jgi:hypothetical protein
LALLTGSEPGKLSSPKGRARRDGEAGHGKARLGGAWQGTVLARLRGGRIRAGARHQTR